MNLKTQWVDMIVRVGETFHVYLGKSLEQAQRDWQCAYPGWEVEAFEGRIPGGTAACRYEFKGGQYVAKGGSK